MSRGEGISLRSRYVYIYVFFAFRGESLRERTGGSEFLLRERESAKALFCLRDITCVRVYKMIAEVCVCIMCTDVSREYLRFGVYSGEIEFFMRVYKRELCW